DTKFFITLCQSLQIPVFTEDVDLNIKRCGLKSDNYIQKLSILEEVIQNGYVNIRTNN
ncbi:hypothetical protein BCR32DRAFT_208639, partial [Anaeromyces robustus]